MGELEGNFEQFSIELESEYEQTQRTLREVEMMLDQSQAELTKLTKRNTSVTAHLQQIQNQFESVPRSDIRLAYNSALDAQQRVLVMRSQLEKLQADQSSLKKRINLMEQVRSMFTVEDLPTKRKKETGGGGSATLEMMINSQETERQRLSRQMHDGPAQALSNFIVQAEIAARLFDLDQTKAKYEMENLKNSAMSTFQKVRNFITELRPMMLDDLGLIPTIKRYDEMFAEQNGIEIITNIKGNDKRFEPYLEIMVFRALQELIGNATRHNQDISVKLQINVQIIMDDNFVKMIVQDNGKGFDIDEAVKKNGLGLKVIRERVEILGGYIDIDSALGQGSRITVQIPISNIVEEKES
jgi:two-component system sensor histidine kinase DegS